MQRFLVAFVSREGLTERVAHHVTRFIEDRGALVRLIDVTARESEAGADDCDALIVVGSLQRGRFDPELLGFVTRHAAALRSLPSAFLAVSVSTSDLDASENKTLKTATQDFLAETAWTPDAIRQLGGIVTKTQPSTFDRHGLFSILEGAEAERRPTGEMELLDWAALDEFVRDFAARVKAGRLGPAAAPSNESSS